MEKEWNSGLLDCFEDISSCCYGFWCCPCLAGTVSNRFGEGYFLPLCDLVVPALFFTCLRFPLFAPPATAALRVAMRNKYNIKGSILKDILASCLCTTCTWCQMHRELKHQNKEPVVIDMPPVITVQPAVTMPPTLTVQTAITMQPAVTMPTAPLMIQEPLYDPTNDPPKLMLKSSKEC